MTDSIFFDNDCISAFLWVEREDILEKLYSSKIVIPKMVYEEMSKVEKLINKVDTLLSTNIATIKDIEILSDDYNLYLELTKYPQDNKIIGKGEAASIVLAKGSNGILASNNLKDISQYVKKFSLKHITTADIMIEAFEKEIITEDEGNSIWEKMISRKRKIGYPSFTNCLEDKYIK